MDPTPRRNPEPFTSTEPANPATPRETFVFMDLAMRSLRRFAVARAIWWTSACRELSMYPIYRSTCSWQFHQCAHTVIQSCFRKIRDTLTFQIQKLSSASVFILMFTMVCITCWQCLPVLIQRHPLSACMPCHHSNHALAHPIRQKYEKK